MSRKSRNFTDDAAENQGRRANQPWRCLWRLSLQITRTVPRRLIILQFRQMRLTEALTFIFPYLGL